MNFFLENYLIGIFALALDAVLGDPIYSLHPVRLIAKLAFFCEEKCNHKERSEGRRLVYGTISAILVIAGACTSAFFIVFILSQFFPPAISLGFKVVLCYGLIALKDLNLHVDNVRKPLVRGDLEKARQKISLIVGRETQSLNTQEVCRAAIETTSENLVDGVTAPLFYLFLGGPIAMVAYKAINTLDSLWGHKNSRFLYFGRTAAKIDDFANYLPARLTAPIIAFVCLFLENASCKNSLQTFFQEGRKHPSPNAGLCEAAMAGGLKVQLGGEVTYKGKKEMRPTLGQSHVPLSPELIAKSLMIINFSTLFFCAVFFVSFTLLSFFS